MNTQIEKPKAEPTVTAPEPKEEPKPKTYSIRSVSFIVAPKLMNQGQLGTVSSAMEWVKITEGLGQGVFSETPGVWLTGQNFRVFIPVTSILQIDYA